MRNLALAIAIATAGTQAGATLVADGKLGDAAVASAHGTYAAAIAEGYSYGYSFTFVDKKGNALGDGSLWFGQDASGNQFLYYMLPLEYVDNSYGSNASAGWGGPGGHTFSDLLGSDSMGGASVFRWLNNTNSARIDYIAGCASDPTKCNSSGYASGGVGSSGTGVTDGANGAAASWTKVDASLTGSAASILQIATSLEYDMKNIPGTFTTNSSTSPNWIQEVGYELQFAPNTFDPTTWADASNPLPLGLCATGGQNLGTSCAGQMIVPGLLTLGDPHVSPPMGNSVASFKPPCLIGQGGCGVPEPSTPLLLGGGLMAAMWFARRRKDASPPELLRGLTPG